MLANELSAMKQEVATLKGEHAASQEEISVLKADKEAMQAENAALQIQLQHLVANGQSVALETKRELPKIPEDAIFTYNKKKYQITAPSFVIPGIGHRTAEETLLDSKAQEALVKTAAGVIREVLGK